MLILSPHTTTILPIAEGKSHLFALGVFELGSVSHEVAPLLDPPTLVKSREVGLSQTFALTNAHFRRRRTPFSREISEKSPSGLPPRTAQESLL
jgi:hypothetical protein